eukprot:1716196-Pyramimonas_sp.AAC.1
MLTGGERVQFVLATRREGTTCTPTRRCRILIPPCPDPPSPSGLSVASLPRRAGAAGEDDGARGPP